MDGLLNFKTIFVLHGDNLKMCDIQNDERKVWSYLAKQDAKETEEKTDMATKLLYLKMCWLRSLSHMQIILTTLNLGMLMAVFLKVYGIDNLKFIALAMILLTIFMVALGHYDVKQGWMKKETALANANNPEIMKLVGERK
jgi:hypothetical protein